MTSIKGIIPSCLLQNSTRCFCTPCADFPLCSQQKMASLPPLLAGGRLLLLMADNSRIQESGYTVLELQRIFLLYLCPFSRNPFVIANLWCQKSLTISMYCQTEKENLLFSNMCDILLEKSNFYFMNYHFKYQLIILHLPIYYLELLVLDIQNSRTRQVHGPR